MICLLVIGVDTGLVLLNKHIRGRCEKRINDNTYLDSLNYEMNIEQSVEIKNKLNKLAAC